jgi:hypothetical protein
VPNTAWYAAMKGQDSPLTGPISKTIQGGRWAKSYEFAVINSQRMANSLIKRVETYAKRVTVEYEDSVQPRADITQSGGEAALLLHRTSGGSIELNVKIQSRVHTGIADRYFRLGFKTDMDHIMDAFDNMIIKHFME